MSKLSDVTILSFVPRPSGSKVDQPSFTPYSIKRNHDGEIFTIGDTFSNGHYQDKLVVGTITGFSMLEDWIYVQHTWSGVGFSLNAITKLIQLPSQCQIRQVVSFLGTNATVIAIHFYPGKVKYDLDLWLVEDGNGTTRIYNVDSINVVPK